MEQVQIYWDTQVKMYRIRCKYNKDFIDRLKQAIPYTDRGWDGTTRTWAFLEAWLPVVERLVEDSLFAAILFTSKAEAEAEEARYRAEELPSEPVTKANKAAIAFVDLCTPEALKAAYRIAIAKLHPDAGGDHAKAAEFNQAYQSLLKEKQSGS